MDPKQSLTLEEDLFKAAGALFLGTELHKCYIITPDEAAEEVCRDWATCNRIIEGLDKKEAAVKKLVGVSTTWLAKAGRDLQPGDPVPDNEAGYARAARRLYAAAVLCAIINETDAKVLAEEYGVPRSRAQALQEQAGKRAGAVASFCQHMGWDDLEVLIAHLQPRVEAGVRQEIVPLTEIPGVDGSSARALFNRGLRTVEAIARADPRIITDILASGGACSSSSPERQEQLTMRALGVQHSACELLRKRRLDSEKEIEGWSEVL